MLPNLSQLNLIVEAPKRAREDDKFHSSPPTFDDLPKEIVEMIMDALRTDDCKELGRICGISRTFREACDSDEFWEIVLKTKELWPTWNSGLPPRRWYAMVCDMAEDHRVRLLALINDTKTLKYEAFKGCTSLALKLLPPNIITIRDSAFEGCTKLALTTLPSGLQKIEYAAFRRCRSLKLTTLSSGLRRIGWCAFQGCTSLVLDAEGAIPSGLQYIGSHAFEGCTRLALTELPSTLQFIGESAFEGCTSLALTALPPGGITIQDSAFAGCKQLKNKDVGRAILQLNPRAFDS
jgi:hypothetical protein